MSWKMKTEKKKKEKGEEPGSPANPSQPSFPLALFPFPSPLARPTMQPGRPARALLSPPFSLDSLTSGPRASAPFLSSSPARIRTGNDLRRKTFPVSSGSFLPRVNAAL